MKSIIASLFCAILLLCAMPQAQAQSSCPYSSVQVRVQPNTSIPWTQSVTVPVNSSVHVGVFQNGWGVPVSPGTVTLYAVQGSLWLPVSLSNGWETWWSSSYAATWSFEAYCGGLWVGRATATYR